MKVKKKRKTGWKKSSKKEKEKKYVYQSGSFWNVPKIESYSTLLDRPIYVARSLSPMCYSDILSQARHIGTSEELLGYLKRPIGAMVHMHPWHEPSQYSPSVAHSLAGLIRFFCLSFYDVGMLTHEKNDWFFLLVLKILVHSKIVDRFKICSLI